MLRWFYLVLLLGFAYCCNASAEYKIEYVHDPQLAVSIPSIKTAPFLPLTQPINNGFQNGIYWLKITFSKAENKTHYIKLDHAHLNEAFLYNSGFILIPRVSNKRFIVYKVVQTSNINVYYLKVPCKKEGAIPLKIFTEEEYLNYSGLDYMGIGLYYGIVLSILFLNLIFFFNFKNKTYLYYSFMLISLAITFAYRDGFFFYFFGNSWITQHIETPINMSVMVSLALFSTEYLQLKRYLPQFKWFGIATLFLPVISFLLYLIKYDFLFHVITDNMVLVSITVYYSTSIVLYQKNLYSKFFAWAYGLLLLFAIEYYNSGFFGYVLTGINLTQFKIGGIIEMSVFTFAISYQANILKRENYKLHRDLESKNKELTTFTMQFLEKNTLIQSISEELSTLKSNSGESSKVIGRIQRTIDNALVSEDSWDEFKARFEDVNVDFYNKLKKDFPDLTNAEIKLAALTKLKLSIKEAAALLNHSERSVVSARSRIRKKFGLDQKANLYDFLDKY